MTKILVIEDEMLLREEVLEWLGFEGYEVVGAPDGVAGVEIALHELPDLIVCDITMPHLDGYGVLLEVHSNPATTQIPFIFMTARAAYDDIRKGMSLGADDYLTKPFTRLEFLQAIETRVKKKTILGDEYKRQVDQLQQALVQEHQQSMVRMKMIAMFSHDFRNPLAAIRLTNRLLSTYGDRIDPQRRQIHRERIEISVRLLMQMLDDVLLIAQMEIGQLTFKPEPLDVSKLIQQIIEELQFISGDTHQILFESHFTEVIVADSRLLRQVATNLISNAVKYSPQGREVNVTLDSQSAQQCLLTVQDHGIGISAEDQSRLFDTFQRGKNVGDISGTGLGLAIVKQSVELHGGSINLESQLGVGTTVVVTIPINQASQGSSI